MSGTAIQVGDYVVLDDEYAHAYTPCRVLNVYKNGNLRARSDDGAVSWHGVAAAFTVVHGSVPGTGIGPRSFPTGPTAPTVRR